MKIFSIRYTIWDQLYYAKTEEDQQFQVGNWLVVKTSHGKDLGKIEGINDNNQIELKGDEEISTIERRAESQDFQKLEKNNQDTKDYLKYCRKLIKKHKLEMKLIDVHLSLDGNKITFAFIADGRIDFRELVKDLVKKYNKAIRLQQVGVRDEVKYFGDIGPCGRFLCCQTHLTELGKVVADFAKNQQVASRGAERLSGVCGRLKCCLAYEEKVYEDLNKKLPPIGSKLRTNEGEGTVVGYHTLKGTVDLEVGNGEELKIIEVKV